MISKFKEEFIWHWTADEDYKLVKVNLFYIVYYIIHIHICIYLFILLNLNRSLF